MPAGRRHTQRWNSKFQIQTQNIYVGFDVAPENSNFRNKKLTMLVSKDTDQRRTNLEAGVAGSLTFILCALYSYVSLARDDESLHPFLQISRFLWQLSLPHN